MSSSSGILYSMTLKHCSEQRLRTVQPDTVCVKSRDLAFKVPEKVFAIFGSAPDMRFGCRGRPDAASAPSTIGLIVFGRCESPNTDIMFRV